MEDNKYYNKLQKELAQYPYKRDYVHLVGKVNIDVPMIYSDASSAMYFFIVNIKDLSPFMKDKRVKPVSIFPGKTLLAINIFEYRESAVGSFNEFTYSVPVMMDSKLNLPVFPIIFDQLFSKLGFYVIQLGASNEAGREHIKEIWGYPTHDTDLNISLRRESGYLTSSIRDGKENIFTISEKLPKRSNLKFQKKKFKTYFSSENELRQVKLDTLLFEKTWLGSKELSVDIGSHQLSGLLNSVKIKKKLATVFYPYAVEIAGSPKKI